VLEPIYGLDSHQNVPSPNYRLHFHQNEHGPTCWTIETLTMAYIFIEMHMALAMPYVPFKTCLTLTMINILVRMHLAHNNILNVFSKT
jgi:hypothetical protein